MKKMMKSKYLYYLGVLAFSFLISIPVIIPFFHKGFFPSHDGEWAVVRLTDMFRELKDHQFPARFSDNLNFGYGYPLFNFTYPLPYYLGVALYFLKFGFVDSIKTLFAISVPLSALFMFFASRELWKSSFSGIVSSIFYIYLPYRFVDLYVRGSIGESLSFILFPLLFFLVTKIANSQKTRPFVAVAAFSYAALMTTHNIMAVLFTLILGIYLFGMLFLGKRELVKKCLFFIFLGLMVSAFFWVPALSEKQNILLSKVPIAQRGLYFVSLKQFLIPHWGYGVPTESNGFSYQLGWPHVLAFFLVVLLMAYTWWKKREDIEHESFRFAIILIVISIFITFLLFPKSAFLWKNAPLLSEINYPWTALAPLGFLVSLLAGFLLKVETKIVRWIALLLSLIAISVFLPYARPQSYLDRGDNYYLANDATTTSSDELMPLWVKEKPLKRVPNKVEVVRGRGEINSLIYNSKKIAFDINAKNDVGVRINTIYYPGWKALVDGEMTKLFYQNEKGVIEIPIKEGPHQVLVELRETPLRFFSDMISLIGTGFVVILGLHGLTRISRARPKITLKTLLARLH